MSIVKLSNNGVKNATAFGSITGLGNLIFISRSTASSSSSVSITSGIDSTYKEYIFVFNNIHPASGSHFTFQGDTGTNTNYNQTITSSFFQAEFSEAGSNEALGYQSSSDQAQGTGYQMIGHIPGNDNDQSVSGTLYLFSPASTTFVKHFISNFNSYTYHNYSLNTYVGGYCNVTAAIDGVDFKFSSGNIDSGVIKMYGLSKS